MNFAHDYLKQSQTYGGVLEELQVELLHNSGCEHYPYLEMEETCAQFNQVFIFSLLIIANNLSRIITLKIYTLGSYVLFL